MFVTKGEGSAKNHFPVYSNSATHLRGYELYVTYSILLYFSTPSFLPFIFYIKTPLGP